MPTSDPTREEAERPCAERALRQHEELFHLLTEHSLDFIRLHDLDGHSVYASRSVENFYGQVPKTLFEFAHPDDTEAGERWWQLVRAGQDAGRLRWRAFHGGRDWHWLESAAAIVQFQGRPHVLTVCRDVTEQVRGEQALRESREQLHTVINTLPVGVLVVNGAGDVILANPVAKHIWGEVIVPGSERWARSKGYWHESGRRIDPDEWASARALTQGLTTLDELIDIETFDGHSQTIQNSAAPLRDADGQIVGAVVINQDVTERVRAEAARHAAELRLEHVVASSPALLFMLRLKGEEVQGIAWMSANVEAMLGYQVHETLGADWWKRNVHPDDRDSVVNQFHAEIFSRGHSVAEYRFRHKNGQYRWLRSEARLLRDEAGRPTEMIGSLSDITEWKQLEDQFRQAQKVEAIGHLAGGVAHDFNNLLTIISVSSEVLLPKLPADDPRREMVTAIRDAGEKAASLTRQLLAFSRQTVLEPRVLDLNELVRENEKMLRRLIGEDVQLATKLDPALDPVKIDPGQLGQVVLNLAVNARDAMPTGGKLTIETANVELDEFFAAVTPEARPGRYVMVAVSDSGTGMTAEVRAHIFEPFFTTKGPGKGTGLGLPMVYGIVKQSGGFISIYSEPGQGTVFRLYFPVVEKRDARKQPAPRPEPLARGTETVLLVEDEEAVRSTVQHLLRDAGYTLLSASRGTEAVRLAGEYPGTINLLVTDVVMPEMGGRELVERLTRQRPGLKVLFLSGYAADAVVRHGVLEAEVAFLQKPFTMAALTNKIREVLDTGP